METLNVQERAERPALSTALGRGGKALTWVAPAPWARSGLQASAEHRHPPGAAPERGEAVRQLPALLEHTRRRALVEVPHEPCRKGDR